MTGAKMQLVDILVNRALCATAACVFSAQRRAGGSRFREAKAKGFLKLGMDSELAVCWTSEQA
jgi:hypothetical protein